MYAMVKTDGLIKMRLVSAVITLQVILFINRYYYGDVINSVSVWVLFFFVWYMVVYMSIGMCRYYLFF